MNPQNHDGAPNAAEHGRPPHGQPYGHPQQEAPGSRYGTQAYTPQAQYDVMQEPKKYRTLLTLTLASLGLYVLNLLLSMLMTGDDKYRRYLEESATAGGQPLSADELEQITSVMNLMMIGTILVSGIIGIAMYLLVYLGLKKKKGWARILGIVFAILGVLSTAGSLITIGATASGALLVALLLVSVAFLVVNVLWLVHAFAKEVTAYLQQQKFLHAAR